VLLRGSLGLLETFIVENTRHGAQARPTCISCAEWGKLYGFPWTPATPCAFGSSTTTTASMARPRPLSSAVFSKEPSIRKPSFSSPDWPTKPPRSSRTTCL